MRMPFADVIEPRVIMIRAMKKGAENTERLFDASYK